MKKIVLEDLLEAGCHFGHRAARLHPKARRFIYTRKDNVHIIDLAKTREGLKKAATFVKTTVAEGGEVLFIATKRQAKGVVEEIVKKIGAAYFTRRFIGGFITNFNQVKKNLEKLKKMTKDKEKGKWEKLTKHEQAKLKRELARLELFYGGVKDLEELPAALFIVDVDKQSGALREARKKDIPVVAIVDTNTDPTLVDYPIPSNDDAVGGIRYITEYIGEAYREGKKLFEKKKSKEKKD